MKQLSLTIFVSILFSFVTVKTLYNLEADSANQPRHQPGGQHEHNHSHAGTSGHQGKQNQSQGNRQNRRGDQQQGQGNGKQSNNRQGKGRRQQSKHHHERETAAALQFGKLSFTDSDAMLQLLTARLALSQEQQSLIRSAVTSNLSSKLESEQRVTSLQQRLLSLDVTDSGYAERQKALITAVNQAFASYINARIAIRDSVFTELNETQKAILLTLEINGT